MVFYLKLNRCIDYSIRNLQSWINMLKKYEGSIVYILCDNEALIERIKNEIRFDSVVCEYIKSIKREEDRDLMESVAIPRWYNAGYAHLTPFIHARQNGFERYWNIDADDTMFGLDSDRLFEALRRVEKYAETNEIDLFSLDMWRSRSNSIHWSFGITYTNGMVDWVSIMRKHSGYVNGSKFFSNWNHPKNIDEYFTYIKSEEKSVKIETFYIENLLFLHYSDDFIMNPITSGVYRWKAGKLKFPIIQNVFGCNTLGEIDIASDVVKIDIGIDDIEGGFALAKAAPFSLEVTNIVEAEEFREKRINHINNEIINAVKRISDNLRNMDSVYIFGFGNFTSFLIDKLRENCIETNAILDNAENKWGGPINGLMVTSPQTLLENDVLRTAVIIDVRFYDAIFKQLIEMGVSEQNIYGIPNFSNI